MSVTDKVTILIELQQKIAEPLRAAQQAVGRFNADVGKQFQAGQAALNEFNTRVNGTGQSLQGLTGKLVKMAAAFASVQAVRSFTMGIINTASEVENLKMSLEVMYGSAEKARQAFELFDKTAAKVPFTLQEIGRSGTIIQGFSKEIDLTQMLTPFLDLAARIKVQNKNLGLEEIASNFGKALTTGIASADLLRDYIRGPLNEYAKLKYSIDDITRVSIPKQREVFIAMLTDTSAGFAGFTDKAATGWTGLMSMLNDSWTRFQMAVSETGFFDNIKDKMEALLQRLVKMAKSGELKEWADKVGEAMSKAADGAWKLAQNIGKIGEFISKYKILFEAFAVMAATAFGLNKLKGILSAAQGALMLFGAQLGTAGTAATTFGLAMNGLKFTAAGIAITGITTMIIGIANAWKQAHDAKKEYQGVEEDGRKQKLRGYADTVDSALALGQIRAKAEGSNINDALGIGKNFDEGLAIQQYQKIRRLGGMGRKRPGESVNDYSIRVASEAQKIEGEGPFNITAADIEYAAELMQKLEKALAKQGVDVEGIRRGYTVQSTATAAGTGDINAASFAGGNINIPAAMLKTYPNLPQQIRNAAAFADVDEDLFAALVSKESNFNPKAVSPKGARGLTQVMPGTWKGLANRLGLNDPWDIDQQLKAGAVYYKDQEKRFGNTEMALAAYNAGPEAVAKARGVPNFKETKNYVSSIMRKLGPDYKGGASGYDALERLDSEAERKRAAAERDAKERAENLKDFGGKWQSLIKNLSEAIPHQRKLFGDYLDDLSKIRMSDVDYQIKKAKDDARALYEKYESEPGIGKQKARGLADEFYKSRLAEIRDQEQKQKEQQAKEETMRTRQIAAFSLDSNAPDAFNMPARRQDLKNQYDDISAMAQTDEEKTALYTAYLENLKKLDSEYIEWKKQQAGFYAQFNLAQLNRMLADTATVEAEKLRIHEEINRRIQDGEMGQQEAIRQGWTDTVARFAQDAQIMVQFGQQSAERLRQGFSDTFFSAFTREINSIKDLWGAVLDDVKRMYIRALSDMLAKKLMFGLFGDMAGGGGLFGGGGAGTMSAGPPSGSKAAGLLSIFGLAKFAEGGIADRPSIFGDKGPEAAVPLSRGRRIPVELRGGGGGAGQQISNYHTYSINVRVDDAQSFLDARGAIIQQIAAAVAPGAVANNIDNAGVMRQYVNR